MLARDAPDGTFTTEYCASNAENFEHEGEHAAHRLGG